MPRVRVAYLDGCLAADEALMGSRGNSGAIVAQLLEGFANGVAGAPRLTAHAFGTGAAAGRALARTREQLPVLRRAGVVDAGARGFVLFLEGALAAFGRNAVTPPPEPPEDRPARAPTPSSSRSPPRSRPIRAPGPSRWGSSIYARVDAFLRIALDSADIRQKDP